MHLKSLGLALSSLVKTEKRCYAIDQKKMLYGPSPNVTNEATHFESLAKFKVRGGSYVCGGIMFNNLSRILWTANLMQF